MILINLLEIICIVVHRRMTHGRTLARPYADPYRTEETWDRDSVLSDWSVDDNVRRLLYEDDASSMVWILYLKCLFVC